MLNNITKREKILGMISAGVIFGALAYNFVIEPLAKRWNVMEKDIRGKEALLRKHNRILRNKEIIEKLHSEYMEYFATKMLTQEEESAIVLSDIEKMARTANVRITNIKPLAIKSHENYNKYTFRITTESPMSALSKFIYDFQSSQQLLKLERMVLRAKERKRNVIKAILHITKISVF